MSNASDFLIENGVLKKYKGSGGDVVIPEGVTMIGERAFSGCYSLKSITLPDGVTSIGDEAFRWCISLARITLPESVTTIGTEAFSCCSGLAGEDGLIIVRDCVYGYKGELENVIIPDGVTTIGRGAFSGCESLASITLPDGVTSIGDEAFSWCKSLKSVAIPDGVKEIRNGVFEECISLTSVVIPEGTTEIGSGAFSGCINLKSVEVPGSVATMGDFAFAECSKLKKFNLNGAKCSLKHNVFAPRGYCSATDGILPTGLIPFAGELYPNFTDGAIKKLLLNEKVWKKLAPELRHEIYMNRQGKSLTAAYGKCVEDPEDLGNVILERLSGKPSAKDCGMAAGFMCLFAQKVSENLLHRLYEILKSMKSAAKALKAIEEDVVLMEKLGSEVAIDENMPAAERLVRERLREEKRSLKDLETAFKSFYSLAAKELPPVRDAAGENTSPTVLMWLLTAHEMLQEYRWSQPDVVAAYEKPGIRPEAAEIVSELDAAEFQAFLRKLAAVNLGSMGHSKKMYLAYPICRYADEELMTELTKRAPKWRSSVSGNDAPPLRTFRMANIYSETRAAMLFADRYKELENYAKIRGADVDAIRDRFLSDVGIDAAGGKVYDLGNQTVTVRLQKDLSFLVELPGGKTAKSLPKKGADEEKYTAANADFSELKKNAKKIVKNRAAILFEDFLNGRGRGAKTWSEAYLNNPLLRQVASLLVWQQGRDTFRLTDSGFICADGTAYTLKEDAVRVAHPMDMRMGDVTAWQKYFSTRGLKQPFEQIWEPVYAKEDILAERYKDCVVDVYQMSGKDKHGIHAYGLSSYSEDYGFYLDDCELEAEGSTRRLGYEGALGVTYTFGKFSFKKFTRSVNHIVRILDRMTVEERIKKDDVSVANFLPGLTLAQITEYIKIATENNCTNVTALLLDYKNENFADYDPMDEFSLEL